MRIAYMTPDEVHRDLAFQIAEQSGATLEPLSLDGPAPDEHFDAVLYDLDFLPEARRKALLAELGSCPAASRPLPVGIHTYNNFETRFTALRRNGVVVARRLGPGVFRSLSRRHAAESVAPPCPVADACEVPDGPIPLRIEILISELGVTLTREPISRA